MDVAVGNLFFAGLAHVNDLHVEIELLTGQRVVAVDGDLVTVHIAHHNAPHIALGVLGLEGHDRFDFIDTSKAAFDTCWIRPASTSP